MMKTKKTLISKSIKFYSTKDINEYKSQLINSHTHTHTHAHTHTHTKKKKKKRKEMIAKSTTYYLPSILSLNRSKKFMTPKK